MRAGAAVEGEVGRAVGELETPALTVDLDRLEANVARAAAYAREHGLALHPHAKTHKTAEIARLQLAAGAAGITVAKSEEAALFAAAGCGRLLAHYPPVGPEKVERLVGVAAAADLTVALDSWAAAEPLARALAAAGRQAEALIELDVGLRRTGLDPAGAVELARRVEGLGGGLRLAGLSCYPGHLRGEGGEIEAGLAAVAATLGEAIELFDAAGLRRERISGGSTRTLYCSHLTQVTELRPGNYVFLDRAEAVGPYSLEDCALRVQASVISTAVPGQVVLDSGSKTLSEAGPPAGLRGFGIAPDLPGLEVERLNEEHAVARVGDGDAAGLAVGDRVELIPNHACSCVNLHDRLYAQRAGVVEAVFPLLARGAVR
ncbi:MAG: alanine racemase [Actinobacteria bacterium]|nr:alanine racemase [Actinomycetota bacterium]